VHAELARALHTELARSIEVPRTIGLVDIAIAVLVDAANGGLFLRRLEGMSADIAGSVSALERLRSGVPVPTSPPPSSQENVGSQFVPPPPPQSKAPRQQRVELPVDRELTEATRLYLGFYETLRTPSENATAEPETIDGRAMWAAFGPVNDLRQATVASVLVGTMLRLRGEPPSPRSRTAGRRVFDVPVDVEPVPLATINPAAHPLLARARAVRDTVEPNGPIHLRHVMAVAIEEGTGPRAPKTRDEDIEAVRSDFRAQIGVDAPPEVVAAWEAYFAQAADARRAAAAPVGSPPSTRAFAGVDVDMVDDGTALRDELRVVDDVVTLCDMLAARGAVPPISVGLFGRWGSGKSYFMALMRRRIDELRRAAQEAKDRREETSYCTEVVQITFNAWHYMDADDLWATLAVHLFGAIAQVDPEDKRARPRAEVVRDLKECERGMETVDRRIERALGDKRLDEAAARMGLEAHRETALGLLGEVGTTVGYVGKLLWTKEWWTPRRRWRTVALVLVVTVVAAVGTVIAKTTDVPRWLVTWLPVGAAMVGTAVKWLPAIQAGLSQVNQVMKDSGLQREDLSKRIEEDAKIRELRAELEAIDRLEAGRDWLLRRAQSTDYTSHLGVLSVLRGDLEALVDKQRRETPDRRIILYIDDLDRCEPSRVVEVLQAVHLLLAFPLFVAVVGVDPRWLLRSLERHYRKVLSASDGSVGGDVDIPETTPHDYLEKIFQIPFSLRPMGADAHGRLVESLAGPRTDESTVPPGDGAARDGGTNDTGGPSRAEPEAAEPRAQETPAAAGGQAGVDTAAERGTPHDKPLDAETAGDTTPAEETLAPVSVNPPQLQITPAEVDALARMGPLIGTPRAAKRLVNLYRLIRAGLPDAEVSSFVEHRRFWPLVIVLAAQVGFPRVSSELLTCLVDGAEPSDTITGRVRRVPQRRRSESEEDQWDLLKAALLALCVDDAGKPVEEYDRPVSELREWIPRLRRYSFEGALAGEPGRSTPAEPPASRTLAAH
jgi:hypothetical protein